jgi:hypothetical protein
MWDTQQRIRERRVGVYTIGERNDVEINANLGREEEEKKQGWANIKKKKRIGRQPYIPIPRLLFL